MIRNPIINRRTSAVVLLIALLALALSVSLVGAQDDAIASTSDGPLPQPISIEDLGRFTAEDAARLAEDYETQFATELLGGFAPTQLDPALTGYNPDESVRLLVQLSGAPALERANFNLSSGQSLTSQVAAEQGAAISSIQAAGGTVTGSVQLLSNTIFVTTTAGNIPAIANAPGVRAVFQDSLIERADTTSVPLINGDDVWDTGSIGGSFTGEGVVISVIDTGIDYTHTLFGGPGDYAAVNDGTNGSDTPGLFPAPFNPDVANRAPKVIGGYDYVGDAYNGTTPEQPDTDPADCPVADGGGHGSHVAGSAAGYGTEPDGSTYTGPYDTTDELYPNFPDADTGDVFQIGPGTAPNAMLVAMRIFGCTGSTATSNVIEAIEDSVAGTYSNGVQADIINMSLGSSYTSGDPANPRTESVRNAVAAGTHVVVAAGNSADFHYILGPTGSADAIVVSNIVDTSGVIEGTVQRVVEGGDDINYPGPSAGFDPPNAPEITGEVVYGVPNNGCGTGPLDNADAIAGKIALLDRGACSFVDKVLRAQASGAIGAIVANNQTTAPFAMGGQPTAGQGTIDIPSKMIGLDDGNDLKANLPTSVNFLDSGLYSVSETPDIPSASTSRGPTNFRRTSFGPHVGAPGTSITSAGAGTGDGIYTISGTSMASPHIAGITALLIEKWPNWTPQQIKARIMNSGIVNITDGNGNIHGPQRVGSGRIDVLAAASNPVIAYHRDDPQGASVSFGTYEALPGANGTITASNELSPLVTGAGLPRNQRVITVENLGDSAVSYNAALLQRTDVPAVSFSISPTSVNVPAGGTAEVTVTISGDARAAGVNAQNDPTRAPLPPDQVYLTEETAIVEFTNANDILRVPVYAYARPAADMRVGGDVNITENFGVTQIPLTGTGVNTGSGSANIRSQVMGLTSIVQDHPNDPDISDYNDIKSIGISDSTATSAGAHFFAIETYEEWGTAIRFRFNIHLDVLPEAPGAPIVYEFTYIAGSVTFAGDRHVVAFFDNVGLLSGVPGSLLLVPAGDLIYPNGVVFAEENTYFYETDVIIMPVLTFVGQAPFQYYVEALEISPDNPDFLFGDGDTVGTAAEPLLYDRVLNPYFFDNNPGFYDDPTTSTGTPLYDDQPGGTLPLEYYNNPLTTNGLLSPDAGSGELPSIMLVHLHNADDAQVSRVEHLAPDVTGGVDVVVRKSLQTSREAPRVEPGETVTFNIDVTNTGATASGGVIVSDVMPDGMTINGVDCGNANVSPAVNGQAVSCTYPTLQGGESFRMTITATASTTLDGAVIVSNSAQAASTGAPDPNPANNTDSVSFCIGDFEGCLVAEGNEVLDLSGDSAGSGGATAGAGAVSTSGNGILSGSFAQLDGSAGFAQRGGSFRYTMTVNNSTGSMMTGINMTTRFSAGVTLSNPSASEGNVSISNAATAARDSNRMIMGAPDLLEQSGVAGGPVMSYTHSEIAAGSTVTVSVTVNVPADYPNAFVSVDTSMSTTNGVTASLSQIVPLVSELPATGEEPQYRELLLASVGGVLLVLLTVGVFAVRRRRTAPVTLRR